MALRFVVVSFSLLCHVRHCMSLGSCSRPVSAQSSIGIFYYKTYFCCDNYETHKEACRECPTGFTSKAGSKCIPCPRNSYGLRCAEQCKCQDDERCDHEQGCVKLDDKNIAIEGSEFYAMTTLLSMFPANKTESNLVKVDGDRPKDASSNNRIVYGIGGGSAISAIIIIALFVFIYKMYRFSKKKVRLESIRSGIPLTHQSIASNTVEDQSAVSEEEHEYEEIDDDETLPEPIKRSNSSSSSTNDSNDNSVTGGTDNDGYLHPYHSLNYPNIIEEKYKENERKNDVDMNIQEKNQYSVSEKNEKMDSKLEDQVSEEDIISLQVKD